MNLEKCFNCNGKIKDLVCKRCKFSFFTFEDESSKDLVLIFKEFQALFQIKKYKNKFILNKCLYHGFEDKKGATPIFSESNIINSDINFQDMANQYFKTIIATYLFI
jgi:hypothetical protein